MKVLFIMLLVVMLVAIAAPVFADKDGEPNDNADWGQLHKAIAETGSISEGVHETKDALVDQNFGQWVKEYKESL